MNCTWPMYRAPYGKRSRYTCGLYQQSHGQECDHNHVDGSVRFALSCLRQRLLSPTMLEKLEKRLTEVANRELSADRPAGDVSPKQMALAEITAKLDKVKQNLALAETQQQYRAVAAVFEDLQRQHAALAHELSAQQTASVRGKDVKSEVAAALNLARRLSDLAHDDENLSGIGEVFRQVKFSSVLAFRKSRVRQAQSEQIDQRRRYLWLREPAD